MVPGNLTNFDAKEGGNVAAYFCTPDLKVVNAVLGNVMPATFLEEAKRAVALRPLDREAVGRAHAEVPHKVSWSYSPEAGPAHAVHQALAKDPLPLLETVARTFFEGILGEAVSDRDVEVVEAGNLFRGINERNNR